MGGCSDLEACNYEENTDLFKKLVALKWELQGKNTSAESLEVLKQQHVPS